MKGVRITWNALNCKNTAIHTHTGVVWVKLALHTAYFPSFLHLFKKRLFIQNLEIQKINKFVAIN